MSRAEEAPPLVAIEHLSKTFPGQRALADVSFEIGRDEIHALVGENGSGKSTLIKVLSGFHLPDPGSEVRIAGEPLEQGSAADSRRHGLRFVHQDLGLIGELSAAENVGLASGYSTSAGRIAWSEQRRLTRQLLSRIGVEFDVDRPVAELRAVERSALAIARALDDTHGDISLLVLDEPSAALPPAECEALFRVVREVVAKGVSVLYVSHRLDEILHLAGRVTVLRDGAYQGTFPTATMDRGRLAELIVGSQVEDSAAAPKPASDAAPVLSVRDLRCDPLDGVDLDVAPGEVLGVAGLSGSGREVLAAAVCGAVPARMQLTLEGEEWAGEMDPRQAERLGLALVLPNRHPDAAIDNFTIGENITLGRLPEFAAGGRLRKRREREAVMEWIRRLDVRPPDPDKLYGLLSGGNQQKVLLAKWFGTRPRVVFMDDPTSGVDIGARHAIYEVIRDHAETGAGFVVCSSDIEDFVGVCDRVVALVEGRVAEELRGEAVRESEILRAISGGAVAAG
ncbi:MAG TPA: sugar ABC transporter ATP-binding protein [Solirubrobacterales bacterium]|nr:sugar ABC transporter ATP-binding protein [Solirubrobacterales bacterium]